MVRIDTLSRFRDTIPRYAPDEKVVPVPYDELLEVIPGEGGFSLER